MKAKKFLSFILAVMLLASLSVTAYAEGTKTLNATTTTDTTTVETPKIEVAYTVTIPSKVLLTEDAGTGGLSGVDQVKLEARIEPQASITVTSASTGTMSNTGKGSSTLAFSMSAAGATKDEYASANNGKSVVITFKSNNAGAYESAADITFTVTKANWEAAAAGTYTGTETFTIAYVAPTGD